MLIDALDEPEQSPAGSACPAAFDAGSLDAWSDTWLLAGMGMLRDRFCIPADGAIRESMAREAIGLADAGLAGAALLAAAVCCVSRCGDCGPAMAYGPWADSALLQSVGGGLEWPDEPTCGAEADLNGPDGAGFLDLIRSGHAGVPVLLVGSVSDDSLRAALREALPGFEVEIDQTDDHERLLSAARCTDSLTSPAGGSESEPLFDTQGQSSRSTAVSLVISQLRRAVTRAQSAQLDSAGFASTWSPAVARDPGAGGLICSAWLALLPELPDMLRSVDPPVEHVEVLLDRWLGGLQSAPSPTARLALRDRARLVWLLASITRLNPVAGFCGLLAGSGGVSPAAVVKLAQEMGVHIEPPAALNSVGAWTFREVDGSIAVSCPVTATRDGGADAGEGSAPQETSAESQRTVVVEERSITLSGTSACDDQMRLLLHECEPGSGESMPGSEPTAQTQEQVPEIIQVEAGAWRVGVSRRLVVEPQYVVEVTVRLTGDREADVSLVAGVHAILDRHPGSSKTRLVLSRSGFKRVVERDSGRGVAFEPDLEEAIAALLGPGAIEYRLDRARQE